VIRRGFDQRREVRRIMREVGVHLADQVRVAMKRQAEALDVRAPEAALVGPVDDLQTPKGSARQIVGQLTRAVRRLIVDDHHRVAFVLENLTDERRQVLALVVGRDDDQNTWHRSCRSKPGRLHLA
jgi:hypothetical protein